jgi:hypothetical protein
MKRTALKRRTPLRKVSTKRAKQNREYTKRRKAFLARATYCEVNWALLNEIGVTLQFLARECPRATEIHHKAGRIGEAPNDESNWITVSREGHCWLHDHPSQARARGWLK